MRAAPSAAKPTAVPLEGFVEVQREVAGDAEDVTHATVPQLIEQELVQRHRVVPAW
jgi:hypothetical protein